MTRRLAWCTLGLVLATPAAAQRRGTLEVGLLVRGTLFDPSLGVETALGVGGQAAVFLAPRWLLEADMSVAGVDGLAGFAETSYRPFHLRVTCLRSYAERGAIVLGLGLVATGFGGDFEESDAGVGGLFGFRVASPRSLVLRADGAMDYVPSPANGAGDNWIAGVQVGVGVAFGKP
jgi:hypothetical protein